MKTTLKTLFASPVDDYKKGIIILLVAFAFIWMPQLYPMDWELNTSGFWSDIFQTYKYPNFVYPPWGLILMLPYKWMHPEGARFFSVLVIGWLVVQQKWSLSTFFSIVLSPYFLVTMARSSIDIFVFVLPILLWKHARKTRWQSIGWGLALSILLLKPQGALFLWPYLFFSTRNRWKDLVLPLVIMGLMVLPVSLIGTPPLFIQWLENLANPSAQNAFYWSINNFSLTHRFQLPASLVILSAVSLVLFALARLKVIAWTDNHTLAALMLASMFLSPYASQQGISSPLAFIPSWGAVLVHSASLFLAIKLNIFFPYLPLWVLFFSLFSFVIFGLRKNAKKAQSMGYQSI